MSSLWLLEHLTLPVPKVLQNVKKKKKQISDFAPSCHQCRLKGGLGFAPVQTCAVWGQLQTLTGK